MPTDPELYARIEAAWNAYTSRNPLAKITESRHFKQFREEFFLNLTAADLRAAMVKLNIDADDISNIS